MPNPPKPTSLKLLQGNPGKRPLNVREPKAASGAPPMPTDLSKAAKKVWKAMVPILLKLGTLTTSDGDALAAYCECKVMWRSAQDSIVKDGVVTIGSQGPAKNPAVNVADSALKQMRAIMSEFGLTPASRTKIHTTNPDQESDLSRLLNERSRIRSANFDAASS